MFTRSTVLQAPAFEGDGMTEIAQIVAVIVAAACAYLAWQSAEASRQSAEAARRTLLAQVLKHISQEYASSSFRRYIATLYGFKNMYPLDFVKRFYETARNDYLDRTYGSVDMQDVCEAQRGYSHLLVQSVGRLLNAGLVDDEFVEQLVGADELELLVDVVEPLERALARAEDRPYDPTRFGPFRRIYGEMKRTAAVLEVAEAQNADEASPQGDTDQLSP